MSDFDTGGLAALTGFLLIIAVVVGLIVIAFAVFAIIGQWKLFKKAGKAGWEAIVPVYNSYVLIEIAGMNWYWIFAACAPILISVINQFVDVGFLTSIASLASTFANIAICYNLQRRFNKAQSWFILSIFFSGFTIPLLGYSKTDVYNPSVPVAENSFLGGQMKVAGGMPQGNQPFGANYYQPGQPAPGPMGQPMGQPMPQPMQPNIGQPVQPMGQPMQPNIGQPVQPMGQPVQPVQPNIGAPVEPVQPAAPAEPAAPAAPATPEAPQVPTDGTNTPMM